MLHRNSFLRACSLICVIILSALLLCGSAPGKDFANVIVRPKKSSSEKTIIDYHMSGKGSIVLYSDGTVDGDKLDDSGFGLSDTEIKELLAWNKISKLESYGNYIVGICADGSVKTVGLSEEMTRQMAGWSKIESVFLAPDYAFGLRKDGRVVVAETYSQMDERFGIDKISGWKNVEKLSGAVCGEGFSVMALCSDGTVKTAGLYSAPDELFLHTLNTIESAVDIDTSAWINLCILENNCIVAWGVDSGCYSLDQLTNRNYSAIAAGDTGSVAITKDNSLCWLGYDPEYYDLYDELLEYIDKVNSTKNVKKVFMDGRDLYIIKLDGSIETIYEFEDSNTRKITEELSRWENIESFEFSSRGYGYVIGRKADNSIVIAGNYNNHFFS